MNTKTVVLNGERINYDGVIDYNILSDEVVVYKNSEEADILKRVEGFGIVVSKEFILSKEILKRFPDSVHLICEAGTGYNNIDLQAAEEKGITVCNVPAYSTKRVAHTVLLLMLNLASSMGQQIRMLERKDYQNFEDHLSVPHIEINDKILGVIGAGDIGKEVIALGKAFGMKILVYTRTPRPDEDGICYVTLERLLKESDFLTLHCPLNEQTHHLISVEQLSLMKKSAFIINTARGPLIDEKALIHALQTKQIAGAALDVQEEEPPQKDNPLYQMENVILTPHMGWRGLETRQRLVNMLAENIMAYVNGKPQNIVIK